MSKRTRERAKDYELGDDGSYRYVGTTWRWADRGQRQPFLRAAWTFGTVAAICLVGVGFIPTGHVGNAFYVVLPYLLAVIGTILVLVALATLSREGDTLRDHVHQSCVVNLTPKLVLGVVASFASAVGAAIQALVGQGSTPMALLFCALMALCGLSLAQVWQRFRTLRFKQK